MRNEDRFNPELTRKIQRFNPEITNAEFIIAGKQVRPPWPSADGDATPHPPGEFGPR